MSSNRLCQRCDLTCTQILEDCIWERGRGNVRHDQRDHVDVAGRTEVYQCSARIPKGPGSLRRGMRFRVWGLHSAIWKMKMFVIWLLSGLVRVHGVKTLDVLDYVQGDWDWRGVPCRC